MKNYTPLENAYSLVVKDNPNDYLEIEIGDEKDISKFQPQVKIMRWDNEVNLSVRFQDDEIDTPTIDTSTDKIKLLTQKKEIHLYEMAPSEKQEAGGYEFEIILKEKPKTNVMSFSMETKGLDFWYQSELTQKGKDKGHIRPDNIVGSYAVYHKNCPINYVNGKLYRTGKFCHIFRPRVEDAEGNWVWGELNIDEQKKELTVTISQEFLDNAVYPIRHAAGLEFGYNTIGETEYPEFVYSDENGTVLRLGNAFSPASNGTLESIHVYCSAADDFNVKGFVDEKDSEGVNSHGKVDIGEKTGALAAAGWKDMTLNDTIILSEKSYVLSSLVELASLSVQQASLYYDDTGLDWYISYYNEDTTPIPANAYGSPPDPWATNLIDDNDRTWSIYCVFGDPPPLIQAKARIETVGVVKTIDTKASIHNYLPTTIAQSLLVKTTADLITRVLISVKTTIPSGTDITYEISTNNGNNWQSVSIDTWTIITNPGKQLLFRATLTSNRLNTAELDTLNIDFAQEIDQTLTAKGNIIIGIETKTQTITSKARIQKSFTQTIDTKSRITVTIQKTIQSKGSIKKTPSRNITAEARIQKSFSKTITTNGRIGISLIQTIQTKGRVSKLFSQTVNSKADIKKATSQTIEVKARIEKQFTQSITSKARIENQFDKTIQVKGNIQFPFSQTINVKADIKKAFSQSIQIKADIKKTSTKSITSKGRINIASIQTITAKGRIKKQFSQTVDAKSNIVNTIIRTITVNGIIKKSFTQTLTANARIGLISQQFVSAKARVQIASIQTISAKAKITATIPRTIQTKGVIKLTQTQTINAKTRIQKSFNQTIGVKGRIGLTPTQTIESKARITTTTGQTINSKARITAVYTQILQSKSSISKTFTQTIDGVGRITVTEIRILTAKTNIINAVNQTINSKGRIGISKEQTIQSKGRIGIAGQQTITAKAEIICLSKPILVTPTHLSVQTSPVYLVWEISSCCQNRNIHTHIEIDKTDNTFNDLEKDLYSFRDSDFEYWNGSSWQTYPTSGISSTYYGNQARVLVTLTTGNKWWSAKGGVK